MQASLHFTWRINLIHRASSDKLAIGMNGRPKLKPDVILSK